MCGTPGSMTTATLQDQTILITGATNGIGRQAALELAKLGATLVITARDAAKGEHVMAQIKSESGNSKIEMIRADLSRMADVISTANAFKAKHSRLDVLINNAGGIFDARKLTADGFEYTFGFNHLAYFLLARELLDVLKSSAPARIVNVSSAAHEGGKINFDDLMGARSYSSFRAYSQSKLANIMFTYALARRLEGTQVTVNALHPGFVDTGFGANGGLLMRSLINVAKKFGSIKVDKGADTVVYLASSADVAGQTGKYWDRRRAINSNAASQDAAAQERLWQVSETLIAGALQQDAHVKIA
jgi:NAD(P)-dependent dehydrogenase (short-subunit alcohol dehydrogenase family)